MPDSALRCAFIPFSGGHLHIRCAGSGPPLVMLHECPRHSLSLLPLLGLLAPRYCCIAVDIPGYGDSDPLAVADKAAGIDDFADALAQLLDQLELRQVSLYGAHTGAAIAVAFSTRWPQRAKHLFLDAPPAFNAGEQQSMLAHYLTPFTPQRDGSHLNALWTRVLDQQTYFPFYDRRAQNRLAAPRYDLAFAQRTVMGFLKAGEHYPTAYRAAILYPTAAVLDSLTDVPLEVFCLHSDLLAGHLTRLPVRAAVVKTLADISRLILRPLDRIDLPHRSAEDLCRRQSSRRRYLQLQNSTVYAEIPQGAVNTVILRNPLANPSPIRTETEVSTINIDLPGFGFSQAGTQPLTNGDSGRRQILDTIAELEQLLGANFTPATTGAVNLLYFFAELGILPEQWAAQYRRPAPPAGQLPLPDLRLGWSGSHLLAAWKTARDFAETLQPDNGDSDCALQHSARIFHYLMQSRETFVRLLPAPLSTVRP